MKEQYIHVNQWGDKFYYSDKEMTVLHREGEPAYERASGHKAWYTNGKLHREDGPAIERADGSNVWFINDKRHREDGPAAEYADGSKVWYIDGVELTEAEFNDR